MEDNRVLEQWQHVGAFTESKLGEGSILYCKNESGEDWYDMVKALPLEGTYVLVKAGVVSCISTDPTKIFPGGFELYWSATLKAQLGAVLDLVSQANPTPEVNDPPPATVEADKPVSDDGAVSDPEAANWPAWEATTIYKSGDKVSHNQLAWQAKHWTQGDEPSLVAEPWLLVSNVLLAWDVNVAYNAGDLAAHNNHQWKAQYWTRGDEPGKHDVWLDMGTASSQ